MPLNGRGSPADHSPGRIPGTGRGVGGATLRTLAAAALARGALSVCSRCCWARSTNWNVQTADCDVTKGPARLASLAGGAETNPRLWSPPPCLLSTVPLVSDSCLGAQLRAAGRRSETQLLRAWISCLRVTRRPLSEKGPTPPYRIPIFLLSLLLPQRPHPSLGLPDPLTCILYPSPPRLYYSTPRHVHEPPSFPPLVSLLALPFLSHLLTTTHSLLSTPPFLSWTGLRGAVE